MYFLSEKQDRGNMIIRFIHKGKAESNWLPVSPQLEDVFLYEYRDEMTGEVMMRIVFHECKKAFTSPILIALLLLFSAFNIF